MKDKIGDKIIITNSSSIEKNFLINNFITEFDDDLNIIRNIKSNKINIAKNWEILDAKVYQNNNYKNEKLIYLKTNFDLDRVQTLYSNLSALNLYELYELRKNYIKLNYSITDINLHLLKIITLPLYLLLIAIFSSLIMLNIKKLKVLPSKLQWACSFLL